MMALKRKKAYEAQVQKLSGARMTIESQLMAIEGATVNLETINAMREGAAALQGIHGSMYAPILLCRLPIDRCF
jgi:charged multivesicular body protein 4